MTSRSERLCRPGMARLGALGGVLALMSYTSPAEACGGLFCAQANPVNQASERIIFAASGGQVTAVVEILYEGPSESFSWVLPVPGIPEVGLSSTLALSRLQGATNPIYTMQTQFVGECNFGSMLGAGGTVSTGASGVGGTGGAGDPVTVLESGTVGPFDYEIISVDESAPNPGTAAVEWLDLNGYDVTALGQERLGPYLEEQLNLLAFRLTKTAVAGSIRPVMLTYDSDMPGIPIRPTAVAANEDMGILVWVLGESRAVPFNYHTLELNETLLNWFNPNQNYNDVVIAAANEAGGHGFVTEYADFTDLSTSILTDAEQEAFAALDPQTALSEFLQASARFASWDGYRDVIASTVPLSPEWDIDGFVGCIPCYFANLPPLGTPDDDPIFGTDPVEFLSELQRLVVAPMQATRALFENHDFVTRLYTTLSPDEMTEDPCFEFNPGLPPVSRTHSATRKVHCDNQGGPWEATLPDGTIVAGASAGVWPIQSAPANSRVLSYGALGETEVVEDNTQAIQRIVNANNENTDTSSLGEDSDLGYGSGGSGCSCNLAKRSSGIWALSSLLALGFAQLRRRARRH